MNRLRIRTLKDLQPLVKTGKYRLGSHAVKHARAEGFNEKDMVYALLHGKELLRYQEEQRLLVLGYMHISPEVKLPLHVIVEYATPRRVDIVTAFIPKDPHRVISRTRLAEMLRYDKHTVQSRIVGTALS